METANDTGDLLHEGFDLTDVETNKRRLLIHSLWLVGTCILLAFSVINFLGGNSQLALMLLGAALAGVANLAYTKFTRAKSFGLVFPNITLLCLTFILVVTGGADNTGLLWVYPIAVIGVLINGYRGGAWFGVGLCLALACMLFLFGDSLLAGRYSLAESVRFVVTLASLLALCQVGAYHEEKAQRLVRYMHQNVKQLAFFDSLTGLANRSSFRSWLQRLLDRKQTEGGGLALIYIDLDDFKQVNDRSGHQVGDRLLAEFGRRLGECVRPTDGSMRLLGEEDVARLAGDEFVVTLPDVDNPAGAEVVAKRILAMFEGGFEVDGMRLPVTASIGIAYFEDQFESAESMLNCADAAMYRAKEQGKNAYAFFSDTIARNIQERNSIEAGLQDALAQDGFKLLYMPIYDSYSLDIVGYEVLLRCESSILPDVGPDRFIPVAEATGLIKPIDLWVLDHAMAGLQRLQQQGFDGLMCVNISAVELHNARFPEQVAELLAKYELRADRIELEITETSLAISDQASQATLECLRKLGLGLSLDDFGTGYTAFTQLMSYPVNCLKIDRSFVGALFTDNHAHCKMVDVIQHLGTLYNLRIIAEGVETEQQLVYLRQIGCDWLQGYHLSRPVEFDDFRALLPGPEGTATALGG
ncbi:MAG: bifunctional diguanylate cyclase/phosphodiesterase [Halieaceae bacterium]